MEGKVKEGAGRWKNDGGSQVRTMPHLLVGLPHVGAVEEVLIDYEPDLVLVHAVLLRVPLVPLPAHKLAHLEANLVALRVVQERFERLEPAVIHNAVARRRWLLPSAYHSDE